MAKDIRQISQCLLFLREDLESKAESKDSEVALNWIEWLTMFLC